MESLQQSANYERLMGYILFHSVKSVLIAPREVEGGSVNLMKLLEATRDFAFEACDNVQKRSMHLVDFAVKTVNFAIEAINSAIKSIYPGGQSLFSAR